MDMQLTDRVVVVTGGSSGIGLETVRQFLVEGARVVACARGQDNLDKAACLFSEAGFGPDRLMTQVCDVLDVTQVEALAAKTVERFGRVDVLVANAGQARISTFATTSDEDWEAEIGLKIFSVVRPVRTFAPLLAQSDAGAIVVVNSLLAIQPEPHMVCTSAARASVQNLVKSLSIELAPTIRVNAILLGTINSGQWMRRFATQGKPGQSMEAWLDQLAREKKIPLARMGRPEEPARAIVFLSAPVSGFTTGAALEVSGGVSRSI